MHPSSGHGNRRLSARWVFACWVISGVEPSLSRLSVWDVAGFGCLGFTDTKSPFPGLSAIHSNWLSCGISERKDQNKQVFINKGIIYDIVVWGYSFIGKYYHASPLRTNG